MRVLLVSLAVVCAVMAVGLIWGWPFWVFELRGWRQHSHGWIALSLALFAASFHPWAGAADVWIDRRHVR